MSKVVRERQKAEKEQLRKTKSQTEEEEGKVKPPKRKRKEDEILEKCEQDPAFLEFLQAHKKTAATWGNDDLADELMKLKTKKGVQAEPLKKKKKEKVNAEFFTLKLRDVPKKARKKDIKAFFAPAKLKSIRCTC